MLFKCQLMIDDFYEIAVVINAVAIKKLENFFIVTNFFYTHKITNILEFFYISSANQWNKYSKNLLPVE